MLTFNFSQLFVLRTNTSLNLSSSRTDKVVHVEVKWVHVPFFKLSFVELFLRKVYGHHPSSGTGVLFSVVTLWHTKPLLPFGETDFWEAFPSEHTIWSACPLLYPLLSHSVGYKTKPLSVVPTGICHRSLLISYLCQIPALNEAMPLSLGLELMHWVLPALFIFINLFPFPLWASELRKWWVL